jgi:hypothetical protein
VVFFFLNISAGSGFLFLFIFFLRIFFSFRFVGGWLPLHWLLASRLLWRYCVHGSNIWFCCAVCLFVGIFFVGGSLNPSHITNTTFRNVSSGYTYTNGGVLYANTSSYSNFTLERCVFASCANAYYGGVLYLDSSSPSVIITSCRFEHNNASYGFDIYSISMYCFTGYTPIISCTTSTISESVYC